MSTYIFVEDIASYNVFLYSDKTFEATTVTNRVEQPTATTDLSKDPESSTPPPSVPEPTIEEGMTDTSICGSDKPLLNKRDPTPVSIIIMY